MYAGAECRARLLAAGLVLTGISLGCVVAYGAGQLASIEVSPLDVTIPVGGTQDFTVIGKDRGGNPVALSSLEVEGTGGTMTVRGVAGTPIIIVRYVAGNQTGDHYIQVWDSSVSGPPASAGAVWGSADIRIMRNVPPKMGAIGVTPPGATMNVGDQQLFTATGADQLGNPYDDYDSVTWSATGGGTLAPSGSTCTYTATSPGDYAVMCMVRAGGSTFRDAAPVTVNALRLASIGITPWEVTLFVGHWQLFTATGADQLGNPYGDLGSVTWSVTGGGTLAPSGSTCTYTATSPGDYLVACVARAGENTYRAEASVTVNALHLASIEITPPEVTLCVGDQQLFTATGKDQLGNPYDDCEYLTWSTGDGFLEISGNTCTYTATSPGDHTVVCIAMDGIHWHKVQGLTSIDAISCDCVQYEVDLDAAIAAIAMTPSKATLDVGDQQVFTATGVDQDGDRFAFDSPLVWTTTGGGTLDPSGSTCTYTATDYGDYTLMCAVDTGDGTFQGSATVSVERPHLAAVVITPPEVTLDVGDRQTFTAIGRNQYGNPFTYSDIPVWTASGEGILDPSGSTCTYTATDYGAFTLRCTLPLGMGYVGTASIGVGEARLTTIEITPFAVALNSGDQQQFTTIARDQFGHLITPSEPLWTVTGGDITPEGMYTAGDRPGEYWVMARTEGSAVVGQSEVAILGVSCSDPGVTVTRQRVSANPQSDPATYDPSSKPAGVLWQDALGFHIEAAGPDGSCDFSITFASRVDTGCMLFRLPDWTAVPWSKAGPKTIRVGLNVAGGKLVGSFVLVPELAVDDSGATPTVP